MFVNNGELWRQDVEKELEMELKTSAESDVFEVPKSLGDGELQPIEDETTRILRFFVFSCKLDLLSITPH